jgi:2-dehydropantoate 2-reductase
MSKSSIAILGAGSVGLGVAATLIEAGADVTLLARGEGTRRLREEGIRVTGVLGEHKIAAGSFAVGDVNNLSALACDILIVTTKTYEVKQALEGIMPAIKAALRPPALLLLQNGWGTADEAKVAMPPGTAIFSGILMIGLERISPTHLHIHAYGDATRVGSLFGADRDLLKPIFDAPRPGFIPFRYDDDIEPIILTKLVYNAALNPLGALRHCTYGDLMTNEETLVMMSAIADEGIRVLKAARGYSRFASGDDYIRGELVPKWLAKVGAHRSSMVQDLEAGRKTEIDYLNGAIIAMGRQCGIATPHNDALVQKIRTAEGTAGENRKAIA